MRFGKQKYILILVSSVSQLKFAWQMAIIIINFWLVIIVNMVTVFFNYIINLSVRVTSVDSYNGESKVQNILNR